MKGEGEEVGGEEGAEVVVGEEEGEGVWGVEGVGDLKEKLVGEGEERHCVYGG